MSTNNTGIPCCLLFELVYWWLFRDAVPVLIAFAWLWLVALVIDYRELCSLTTRCKLAKEVERSWDSNSEKEKRGGKKIFLLSYLPPNFLVIFISFYSWLIFNSISFCFILFFFVFILALRLLLNPFSFCHGDGYRHTPNWHAPRRGVHDLINALRRIVWVRVKRGSHPYYSSHILCGLVYVFGRLFYSTLSV